MPTLRSLILNTGFILTLLLLLAGCGPSKETQSALEAYLASEDLPHRDALQRVYAARDYRPIWTGEDGLNGRAEALLAQVCTDTGDPYASAERLGMIEEALAKATPDSDVPDSVRVRRQATLEMSLSEAFLQYALQRANGRVAPERVDSDWHLQADTLDLAAVLASAADNGLESTIETLDEQHEGYAPLQKALETYQEIQAAGGWPAIPEGEALERGSTGGRVSLLRKRLAITGDLADSTGGPAFDEALEEGVRHFQQRHGLEVDGVVSGQTLAALNVPVEARVRQLQVNLERRRWLPGDYGDDYLVVNIPDFRLYAYHGGNVELEMPVIVGTRMSKTPVFADTMTYVVFSPYWNVPEDIAVEELLPKIENNPDYLTRNDLEAVSENHVVNASLITEEALRENKVRIRQKPGPGNSLGRVKFMFPNDYSIYLHDTPADHLFSQSERDFSHGCVRVERPAEFAAYVLRGREGWDQKKIDEAMQGDEEQQVALAHPLPVYLIYMTAWADDGTVQFRSDVYNHDAALWQALSRAPSASAAASCKALTGQDGNRS